MFEYLDIIVACSVGDGSLGSFVLVPSLRYPDDVSHVGGDDPVITEILIMRIIKRLRKWC